MTAAPFLTDGPNVILRTMRRKVQRVVTVDSPAHPRSDQSVVCCLQPLCSGRLVREECRVWHCSVAGQPRRGRRPVQRGTNT